ncbi:MAG: DNA-processing protein DprA [Fimbriimonadaceae bacterium]|nr:DNA-processing protein DprA [Fimbriimonadaceae bacterium]
MQPAFWQRLLAAETHPSKGRALAKALGPLNSGAERLLSHPRLTPAERQRAEKADIGALERALEEGARLLLEPDYPEPLAQSEPAPALFAWGDTACLHRPTVGIVGTRGASTYGKAAAHKFAEAFARAGVTVVSGGALGIDAAAHHGALEAGGATVAVLANGIDKVYPAVHAGLFRKIRESGCLVSQFAAGIVATPYRFLLRNHVVAALSQALLVVEAPERSGALSTAHASNDLGRPVFVVPANIENLKFRGSHALIRDGASLVDHPDQVLESLGLEPFSQEKSPDTLTKVQKRILDTLATTPQSAEHVVDRSGLDASEVMVELTMLELSGHVLREQGGYARKP